MTSYFDCTDEDITYLQSNLKIIRLSMGLSLDKFAKRFGLTKQSISNYEQGRCKLNKPYYVALRTMIDEEIVKSPDNKLLHYTIHIIFDDSNSIETNKQTIEQILAYIEGCKRLGVKYNINDLLLSTLN